MAILKEKQAAELQKLFSPLTTPVRLIVFTKEHGCHYCEPTVALIEELAGQHNLLATEIHDLEKEPEIAARYGIDKAPGIVLLRDGEDPGLRFFGIPAGHEFGALIEAILDLGTGRPLQLQPDTLAALQEIQTPVQMQVFVTPT